MKINLIIHTFYPAIGAGGPVFSTIHTTRELAKKGVQIFVSTTDCNSKEPLSVTTNEWLNMEDNLFVKYYRETILGKISIRQLFFQWQDIRKCDIIHIQGIFNITTPIGLIYAKIFKKPIMISPRGAFGSWCIEQGSKLKSIWLKTLIEPYTKHAIWHATSNQEKNEVLSIFPNVKTIIIPNGIDIDNIPSLNGLDDRSNLIKKYCGSQVVNKVIISMGRLEKKKGFDILINSFNMFLNHYPDSRLLIAGRDEGERENLQDLITSLAIKDKVLLVGQVDGEEKELFFHGADLFVLPSHNENFGNVYAESLAAGTPIVASINTPWEEIEEAGCGKWVQNTVEETQNAMIDMLKKDRDEMRMLSQRYIKKFDWKNIAQEFKKVYEDMI